MKPRLIVAALILVGTLLGIAKGLIAQQGTSLFYGAGQMSCGVWTAQATNAPVRADAMSWLLGFVSGAGAAGPTLRKTDPPAIELWVNQFCQHRSLVVLGEAATEFVVTLQD